MSDDTARAEPIGRDIMRVRFLLPVEVDGGRRENHEADVTPDEARALVDAGRAEIIGEPLMLSDEERAALPAIGPVEPGAETVVGEIGQRPADAHPGEQMPGQDVPPATSGPSPSDERHD